MRRGSLAICDYGNLITSHNRHNIKLAMFKRPGLSPRDVKRAPFARIRARRHHQRAGGRGEGA